MKKAVKRWFKDVLLAVLVVSSLVMVYRIWFGRYLSSNWYDDSPLNVKKFVSTHFSWLSGGAKTFSENMKILLKPEKIVVNQSANRVEITANDARYENLRETSEDFLKNMLLGEAKILSKSSASQEEYFSALKGKSLFVCYGNKIDSRLVSMSISGESKGKITDDVSELKEVLILLNDNVLNNVNVYIADTKNDNVVKYSVEYNKARLDKAVGEIFEAKISGSVPSYSFELNFHKSPEGESAKVLFSPTILLQVVPEQTPCIYGGAIMDFSDEHGINNAVEDAVLRAFKMNPMTMRKFTDVSGSAVFVENYGTLVINPSGLVEFKAEQGSNGITLSENASAAAVDVYEATTLAVDFISNVCAVFPNAVINNLQINSDITSELGKSGSYTFKFDYFISGSPVFIQNSEGKAESAIELTLENGNLVYYRQHLKEYYTLDEATSGITAINAADKIVENTKEEELPVYIKRLSTCFLDNGDEKLSRLWVFELDRKSEPILVK